MDPALRYMVCVPAPGIPPARLELGCVHGHIPMALPFAVFSHSTDSPVTLFLVTGRPNGKIEGMLEIVASMPFTADLLGTRVNMILEDEKATYRVYTGKLDAVKAPGEVDGFTAAIGPTSITLLRRSAQLQTVVQKLSQEMGRSEPMRKVVIKSCLGWYATLLVQWTRSRCTRWLEITHYRAQKLHVSTLDTISLIL